jgi:integrase
MSKKRRFGRVRQLPSGRYQARYQGPDGLDRAAPETFGSKTDAEVWLTLKEAEILNGDWTNPDDGKVPLADYAQTWIADRPGLRPKTVELYGYLLRKHIAPVLGGLAIADIQASKVRRWRKQLIDSGVSAVTVAKAYRLLKAVLNTALDDGVIRRNPCRIKGAGQEESPERPTLTIAQVYALADAVGQRYRALILLAMFSSLRWGELGGLRRCDIDLAARTVRVTRQLNEVSGGGFEFGPPKSRAGKRSVPIPAVILPIIRWHLACFAQQGEEGLVFTSPAGKPLRHTNFRRRVWLDALGAAELPAIHFHDLRHTGNTLAANAGASLRELMERMGHDSERAALVYLHSSEERQHQIADTLSKLAAEELKRGSKRQGGESTTRRSGTPRARNRKQAS